MSKPYVSITCGLGHSYRSFFFHNFHTSMFFSQIFIFQIFLILCAKLNFPVFCFWRISLLSQYIPPIISKLWSLRKKKLSDKGKP